jgi:hypothetical protein
LLLVAVVGEGYLALSSTVNQGTAFALPWLPALIVLAVAAASGVRARAVRFGLAALLVGVCGYNLAVKNGVSGWLSEPRLVDVPLVGNVTASDGRDPMYQALDGRGYPVKPPPAVLPAVHKRWEILNDRLVRFMTSYSARYGQAPDVIVATGDYFINDTRLAVASEVIFRRRIGLGLIAPPTTVDSYRRQFAVAGNNFLLLSDPPRAPGRPVNQLALALAAQRSGFREAKVLRAPDGRRVRVWWRGASLNGSLGSTGYP